MKNKIKETNHAEEQAVAQLESIKEMLNNIKNAKTDEEREEAEDILREDALEVSQPKTYSILLCWGGPAVRIVGELNEYDEPETARIEYQDWFTGWTEHRTNGEDEDALLEYARHYYFGE
jgi:hypothetical protein